MTSVGIFVGEAGNWDFFHEVFGALQQTFTVDVFSARRCRVPVLEGRLNRWLFDRRMRSMLQRNDACFFEWASELLWPASQMPKAAPIVTRLHSYELNVWAPRINWDRVERIICVSEHILRKFTERYPAHRHKTVVVNNGVALDRFVPREPPPDGRLNLGMLGSLHPVNRIYEAVLNVYELKRRGYRPHLHIGGGEVPGGYFDSYAIATRRLVQQLGLDTDVTFHGRIEAPERWLPTIDIFVSNSYWEGQQVALLEALAAGCYCLSHAWDGADEVLPPERLFRTGVELQDKIVAYHRLPAGDKAAARHASRQLACERFDIERTKGQIRNILLEVV